jgi:hypothetical protein
MVVEITEVYEHFYTGTVNGTSLCRALKAQSTGVALILYSLYFMYIYLVLFSLYSLFSKRKSTNNSVYILMLWNCFENTAFNLILLFVVVIVLSLIVVLNKNGQFFSCATIASSE